MKRPDLDDAEKGLDIALEDFSLAVAYDSYIEGVQDVLDCMEARQLFSWIPGIKLELLGDDPINPLEM